MTVLESIGENPSIALRSKWLTVDDTTLWADVLPAPSSEKIAVSPETLATVLVMGRRAILQGIEGFYHEQLSRHPGATVDRPAIWTARLGTTVQTDGRNSQVFTERGYANGGVVTMREELQPRFHGHFEAVREAGFVPEVRRTAGGQDSGSWLLLRKPSLSDVLQHWFEFGEGSVERAVHTIADKDTAIERRKLHVYRMLGEAAVDMASSEARSRKQIGLILLMGGVKSTLGDTSGYEAEMDDAFTYADNDPRIDVSTVRAMENSTFEGE